MQTLNIFTNEPDSLPSGKADFLLAACVTKTCDIPGLTQTNIPEKISLTPTLDAEFMANQKVFSFANIPETSNGVPSPVLITKAVGNLVAYSNMEVLNLGMDVLPQKTPLVNFDIKPSGSVATGANIDAKEIFEKGMIAGKNYELKGNYLLLAESIPSGTITAATTALALGYDCADDFSSSFLDVPISIKNKTITQALSLIDEDMSNFEKLSVVSDNMLIFCAGFILEASRRFHVVLAGATQMASCLLLADKVKEDVLMRVKSDNITLATTSWALNDEKSDIKHLLSLLSYTPHAIYTSFSFAESEIPVLKKYDEGEIKEGVGAGAALAYANANGIKDKELLDAIELIIYEM